MLNSIFKKTVFEKRWLAIGWSIAAMLFTIFIIAIFPVFRDTIGENLKQIPDSMKGFMGDVNAFQELNAFVDVQVIYQMVFLPIIMGIILCTGLLAGKEEQGLIQSLLAQPAKRARVYVDMLMASWAIIAIVSFSIFIAGMIGSLIIGERLNSFGLLQACFSTWLVTVLVSTLAYVIGAVTSKRGFAGMIVGIYVFLMYIITSLVPSVKVLKYPNYLSPFKYFNTPSVLLNNLTWYNVLIMIAVTALLFGVGYWVFTRRDIYQK
jgi:ABC-2 type transport system permease protein